MKGIFEISGWAGKQQYEFEGETVDSLVAQLNNVQDLRCLVQMGDGEKGIKKLEKFLEKYYADKLTVDDLKSLDIDISIGRIKCIDVK